jgi:hypothetical protein
MEDRCTQIPIPMTEINQHSALFESVFTVFANNPTFERQSVRVSVTTGAKVACTEIVTVAPSQKRELLPAELCEDLQKVRSDHWFHSPQVRLRGDLRINPNLECFHVSFSPCHGRLRVVSADDRSAEFPPRAMPRHAPEECSFVRVQNHCQSVSVPVALKTSLPLSYRRMNFCSVLFCSVLFGQKSRRIFALSNHIHDSSFSRKQELN